LGLGIDLGKPLLLAKGHDFGESRFPDMPTPVKDSHDREREDQKFHEIADDIPPALRDVLLASHQEYEARVTPESVLVKMADIVDGLCQTIENEGSIDFNGIATGYLKQVEEFCDHDRIRKCLAEFALLSLSERCPILYQLSNEFRHPKS